MIGPGISIPAIHKVADSINVIAGTPTGTVADIQNWQDGNILQIQEAAATPAMEVDFNFIDVESIRRIGISMYYQGSTTHWIEVEIYNFTTVAWEKVFTYETGNQLDYKYADLPVSDNDFIDINGNAKMRICHPTSGNASHDALIDYVALIS